jgi:Leucine-rich repeat (LRR) protein
LERLKTKSLLERLGDGVETVVGMHDLWRAFCEAELQFGELRSRRGVYAKAEIDNELVETDPPGNCWENVKRMAFVGNELTNLNLSQLTHLKSLELSGSDLHRVVLQGLPRSLTFLRSSSNRIPQGLHKDLCDRLNALQSCSIWSSWVTLVARCRI